MIALTGGKTGGHIMPLLALAEDFKSVVYVGAKSSLEERLCKERGIEFIGLNLPKPSILNSLRETFKLKKLKPEAIISTGGYVSLPLIIYGIFKRIPIYLLEENVIMGTANKIAAKFAKKVFLTYPLNKMKAKYEVVGLPLINLPSKQYPLFDVLIIGGSLGSKPLCELAKTLSNKYHVSLVAGRYYQDYVGLKNVDVYEYVSDLRNLINSAKIVISRAGAGTTYDIFSVGKPSILIPSLKTKKNHQYLNALYLSEQKCCLLIEEKMAKDVVLNEVASLLNSDTKTINMVSNQKRLVIADSRLKIKKILEDEGYDI